MLIVGCGCRGRLLGQALITEGLSVRGTSREAATREEAEAAGIEAVDADPNFLGTVVAAVDGVSVVVWLLASARGGSVEDLHGGILERFLDEMVDTPVRGFVYEAEGVVPVRYRTRGRRIVEAASERSHIPIAAIESPVDPLDEWVSAARLAVLGVMGVS